MENQKNNHDSIYEEDAPQQDFMDCLSFENFIENSQSQTKLNKYPFENLESSQPRERINSEMIMKQHRQNNNAVSKHKHHSDTSNFFKTKNRYQHQSSEPFDLKNFLNPCPLFTEKSLSFHSERSQEETSLTLINAAGTRSGISYNQRVQSLDKANFIHSKRNDNLFFKSQQIIPLEQNTNPDQEMPEQIYQEIGNSDNQTRPRSQQKIMNNQNNLSGGKKQYLQAQSFRPIQQASQNLSFQKTVTICGYLDSIQNFVQNYVKKPVQLKDNDKKDFTKIYAQVPKRKTLSMNFIEDDPRVPQLQAILMKKIFERLDQSDKKNYLKNHSSNKNQLAINVMRTVNLLQSKYSFQTKESKTEGFIERNSSNRASVNSLKNRSFSLEFFEKQNWVIEEDEQQAVLKQKPIQQQPIQQSIKPMTAAPFFNKRINRDSSVRLSQNLTQSSTLTKPSPVDHQSSKSPEKYVPPPKNICPFNSNYSQSVAKGHMPRVIKAQKRELKSSNGRHNLSNYIQNNKMITGNAHNIKASSKSKNHKNKMLISIKGKQINGNDHKHNSSQKFQNKSLDCRTATLCSNGLRDDDLGVNTITNCHDIIPHTKVRDDENDGTLDQANENAMNMFANHMVKQSIQKQNINPTLQFMINLGDKKYEQKLNEGNQVQQQQNQKTVIQKTLIRMYGNKSQYCSIDDTSPTKKKNL